MILLNKMKLMKPFKPLISTQRLNNSTTAFELKLKEFGDLESSVFLNKQELLYSNVKQDEILVKLIGSPINPADLNIIQGNYALLPKTFPAYIGNEGVFEVIKSNEKSYFKPGDLFERELHLNGK